jgi:hypothetical protein
LIQIQAMPWLLYSAWTTIALLILTFIIARSSPVLFAIVGQIVVFCFWLLTFGMNFTENVDKYFLLLGIELFWAGLLIIRIMLKRSVSLKLLAQVDSQFRNYDSSPWIAARLEDAMRWDLVKNSSQRYDLTKKGKMIAAFVRSLHWILPEEK